MEITPTSHKLKLIYKGIFSQTVQVRKMTRIWSEDDLRQRIHAQAPYLESKRQGSSASLDLAIEVGLVYQSALHEQMTQGHLPKGIYSGTDLESIKTHQCGPQVQDYNNNE
ncbi:hypothetical protein A2U01_0015607 [Trifolium medium]|uniref:Uncharacterized protein n=1 Tax=Trifolium medium TaxID=97028 RepID=A0A392N832_9FABA|nr:hypothetical protein [Trifolium medium]